MTDHASNPPNHGSNTINHYLGDRWRWTRRIALASGLTGLVYQFALGLYMVLTLPVPNPGVPIMLGSIIAGAILAAAGSLAGFAIDLTRVLLSSSTSDR